jgi:hypothetical protein
MAIFLQLECGAGGTPDQAIADACGVASRLRIWVRVNINGIETLIAPDDSSVSLHANWKKAIERGATFVSANVIPNG